MSISQEEEDSFVQACRDIITKVRATGRVSKSDFPQLDAPKWSYAHRAILAALQAAGWNAQLVTERKGETRLEVVKTGDSHERRYHTRAFPTDTERAEKRKIGRLVSLYLGAHNRRVLLGSGSTVFWVGRALAEFSEDVAADMQEFWTFNIALASFWCEFGTPFDQIGIVDGLLDSGKYRYRRLEADALGFPPPVFVFGADGCHYDKTMKEGKKASFYALQSEIAANTNSFLKTATDSVICCVTGRKLEYAERQNAGEKFAEPENESVQKILVTNQMPEKSQMTRDLEHQDAKWKIVSKLSDWKKLPEGEKIDKLVARMRKEGIDWDWEELER